MAQGGEELPNQMTSGDETGMCASPDGEPGATDGVADAAGTAAEAAAPTGANMKSATIKALFWKLFEQGGTAIATLLVQVVMARMLDPDEFGMLAIMLVFVNVGNVIVQSGLNTAIIQAPDVSERDYSTVFWMSLGISLLLYAGIFLAAPLVAAFYEMPAMVWPLRGLVLVLIINAYNSIQEAIVARQLQFNKTARATVVAGLVSGGAGVAAAALGAGIWSLVIQQLVQQGCKCVVLASQVSWKPRLVFERKRAVTLFRFGWKLLVSGVLDQAYQSLSDLIIGKVFTSTQLGYVSQGKKYPYYMGSMLDGIIQPVMLSTVSRVQDDRDRVKRLVRRALKTSTFIIVPAMTCFAIAATPIVRLILGEKWLPSVPFLQLYCIVYALLPIQTTNLQALNGMGRSDLFLRLEVIKKVLGVTVICFTSFVIGDIYAIVIGSVCVSVASTFINASPNKKVIGYSYSEQLRDILPAFLLALVSAVPTAAVGMLGLGDLLTIVLEILVMIVAYLGLAAIFKVEEFSYLMGTLRDLVGRKRA